MRDRRRVADLKRVVAIHDLERLAASQVLALAVTEESQRLRQENQARTVVDETLAFWDECLETRSLDPHLIAGLELELTIRDRELTEATRRREAARDETELGRNRYAQTAARAAHAAKLMRRACRKLARNREEASLAKLEDRLAYDRMKR